VVVHTVIDLCRIKNYFAEIRSMDSIVRHEQLYWSIQVINQRTLLSAISYYALERCQISLMEAYFSMENSLLLCAAGMIGCALDVKLGSFF
jgi:hypothetical protein